jgi:hypothetical protein
MRCLLSFGVLIAANVSVAEAASDHQKTIYLLLVKPPNDAAHQGMIAWSQLFSNNRDTLLSGLQSPNNERYWVSVYSKEVPAASRRELQAWWSVSESYISLSAVATQDDKITAIDNDIYLGDLAGALSDPFLHVTQEITPRSYRISRDALAIITLYAYAMDIARNLPVSSSQGPVCAALSRANLFWDGLTNEVHVDLQLLHERVVAELASRRCGPSP